MNFLMCGSPLDLLLFWQLWCGIKCKLHNDRHHHESLKTNNSRWRRRHECCLVCWIAVVQYEIQRIISEVWIENGNGTFIVPTDFRFIKYKCLAFHNENVVSHADQPRGHISFGVINKISTFWRTYSWTGSERSNRQAHAFYLEEKNNKSF